MARQKNYEKQIESLQKKLAIIANKRAAIAEEDAKLKNEQNEVQSQIDALKLEQLQQLMAEKGIGVDQLEQMIDEYVKSKGRD